MSAEQESQYIQYHYGMLTLTLGEAQRLLQNCYRPGFRSEPCTELRVADDRGHRKTVKDKGTKRNRIQIMMRTCTMLACTMRNHIEIVAK